MAVRHILGTLEEENFEDYKKATGYIALAFVIWFINVLTRLFGDDSCLYLINVEALTDKLGEVNEGIEAAPECKISISCYHFDDEVDADKSNEDRERKVTHRAEELFTCTEWVD